MWEKIAHKSLQETLLWSIMQVVYEDHGAKIKTYFWRKKKLRIDEVSLLQLNTCTGTCIYTHNICVNNLSKFKKWNY